MDYGVQYDFTFGARLGLSFSVEASVLSMLAGLTLLSHIMFNTVRSAIRPAYLRSSTGSHMKIYLVNLLISDLIQATGGIIHTRWITDARITEGSLCTAQAIIEVIGEVAVALATLAIALQTFCNTVLGWKPKTLKVPMVVITAIWVFIALMVGISGSKYKNKGFWGPTGYWCWITAAYPTERIAFVYVWLWFTCLVNILLYIPVALTLRGNMRVDKKGVHLGRKAALVTLTAAQGGTSLDAIAPRMLYYPAVYIVTVIPLSATRWLAFQGRSVSLTATMFAQVLFLSSGLFNALLFAFTRPTLVRGSRDIRILHSPAIDRRSFAMKNLWGGEVKDHSIPCTCRPRVEISVEEWTSSDMPDK